MFEIKKFITTLVLPFHRYGATLTLIKPFVPFKPISFRSFSIVTFTDELLARSIHLLVVRMMVLFELHHLRARISTLRPSWGLVIVDFGVPV